MVSKIFEGEYWLTWSRENNQYVSYLVHSTPFMSPSFLRLNFNAVIATFNSLSLNHYHINQQRLQDVCPMHTSDKTGDWVNRFRSDRNCILLSILPPDVNIACHLRTTVPLVSYIRNFLRVWYYASLKLLRKIGVTRKTWEKAGVKL